MAKPRLINRISYNTAYFALCLLLAALILVTPGDVIEQAFFQTHQYLNMILIAIVFVATFLAVGFVYALRLYITRTVLASIPKDRIPLRKGDGLKKEVRSMIMTELRRSAAIAWAARPKVMGPPSIYGSEEEGLGILVEEEPRYNQEMAEHAGEGSNGAVREDKGLKLPLHWPKLKKTATAASELGISLPPTQPVWGYIEHPGWGPPDSPDLPNIQYDTILAELPNLIEAKAVSLAPPNPESPEELDPDAVLVLQRAGNMGIRDYLTHLTSLGVLPVHGQIGNVGEARSVWEFVDMYERAQFGPRPMYNSEFRDLMQLFATLLRSMRHLDPTVLDTMRELNGGMYGGSPSMSGEDIDDDAPRDTNPTTPTRSLTSRSHGSSLRTPSVRRPSMQNRNSSAHTWGVSQYGTAPSTPQPTISSLHPIRRVQTNASSRSGRSMNSFAQTRRVFTGSSLASSSSRSMRSQRSGQSEGSVIIRLREDGDTGDGSGLPYVIMRDAGGG